MALIQSLMCADESGGTVSAVFDPDSMFVREDFTIEPLALLECIAQACAAYGGWKSKAASTPIKTAFLAAVRSFEVLGRAVAGRRIEIEVKLVREFGGFHMFEGILLQDNCQVARCNLKAYHPEDGGIGA